MDILELTMFFDWLKGFSWYKGLININFHPKYCDISIDTRTMSVYYIKLRNIGGRAMEYIPDYMLEFDNGKQCIVLCNTDGRNLKYDVELLKESILECCRKWGNY